MMSEKQLRAMIHTADLTPGSADRAELADALAEAGRDREAAILRGKKEARAHRGEVWRVAERVDVESSETVVLVTSPKDPPCAPLGGVPVAYLLQLRRLFYEGEAQAEGYGQGWYVVCEDAECYRPLADQQDGLRLGRCDDSSAAPGTRVDWERTTGRALRAGERIVLVQAFAPAGGV
jgi:hypothetical protein